MTESAYHRQARELHGRLYEWVEIDGVSWRQIAERLAIPEWRLAKGAPRRRPCRTSDCRVAWKAIAAASTHALRAGP
jgi:hypothetical protein